MSGSMIFSTTTLRKLALCVFCVFALSLENSHLIQPTQTSSNTSVSGTSTSSSMPAPLCGLVGAAPAPTPGLGRAVELAAASGLEATGSVLTLTGHIADGISTATVLLAKGVGKTVVGTIKVGGKVIEGVAKGGVIIFKVGAIPIVAAFEGGRWVFRAGRQILASTLHVAGDVAAPATKVF